MAMGHPGIVFHISHSSMHATAPAHLLISFLWRPFALSILHYPNIWFQRFFFFFFLLLLLVFLTQIVVLIFAFKQQFFVWFLYERQTVMKRWDTWVEVQESTVVCVPSLLLLQAPWKHCLVPQGLEKTAQEPLFYRTVCYIMDYSVFIHFL